MKYQKESIMKRLWITALIATAALAAGPNNMMSFSDFDSDGNGQIAQHEFESAQAAKRAAQAEAGKMMRNVANAPTFGDVDSDGNGYINAEELQNHQAAQRAKRGGGQGQGQGMGRGQGMNQ
jgi:hypothetical protein